MSEAVARTGAVPATPAGCPASHNLPAQLTRFVGRAPAVAEVQRLLQAHRLVTLTGPGGHGKTRLALETGRQVRWLFPHGVWLVELAALQDPARILRPVAEALGVREEAERPLLDTLCKHCRERRMLLILDNCEHLVGAAATAAWSLLQGAPELSILATSREALAVAGEAAWPVPSLAVPQPDPLQPGDLAEIESVALFVDRAAVARPGFVLTPGNTRLVAQICRLLEGSPLAIELAAARVAHLAVAEIAARLDDRFRLLTGGSRTAAPRHKTLQAAVDWSYDLLPGRERSLLARLAVFVGGFTLAAVEAICAGEDINQADVLDLLAQLVSKSLVIAEPGETATRYSMLETIRQYAAQKLQAAGETPWRKRHRDWYLALAEQSQVEGGQMDLSPAWQERLEQEHDNLRAALRWSLDQGDVDLGWRLVTALSDFWAKRFHAREGLSWLEAFLERAPAQTAGRAWALLRVGALAFELGRYDQVRSFYAEAAGIARQLGEDRCLARALLVEGHLAGFLGDFDRGIELLKESRELYVRLGYHIGVANAANQLAKLVHRLGDGEQAAALYAASLDAARAHGDRHFLVVTLNAIAGFARGAGDYAASTRYAAESLALTRELGLAGLEGKALFELGSACYHLGQTERAGELLAASLARHREVKDKYGAADTLVVLGRMLLDQTRYTEAAAHLRDSLSLRQDIGDQWGVADSLGALGGLAAVRGEAERAASLLGAAAAHWRRLGSPSLPHASRHGRDRDEATARAALGDQAFAVAYAVGGEMPVAEAIALALAAATAVDPRAPGADLDAAPPAAARSRPGVGGLSVREAEIVGLVAEGLTDREVGARLYISPRTVDTHLRNIFAKVGVTSRTALATWAVRNGLAARDP